MKNETNIEPVAPRAPAFLYRRISWGAIFAGLLVTIVVQLTFTMLGASIGAATLRPLQDQNSAGGLTIEAAVWLLATGVISMFTGACVAGRLSGGPRRADGMLHGLVTWSAATLATIFFATAATTGIVGGLGSLINGAVASESLQSPGGGSVASAGESLPPTGREQNAQTVDDKATGVVKTALWGFIALVVGGVAAACGGWTGTASLPPRPEILPTAAPV